LRAQTFSIRALCATKLSQTGELDDVAAIVVKMRERCAFLLEYAPATGACDC
jgi:hypothetical protein